MIAVVFRFSAFGAIMLTGYILAILSGVAAALGALSYRYGAKGNVPTIELQTAMSLAGVVLNR